MAATQTFKGQPAAAPKPVVRKGIVCVVRAGGIKTAGGPEQRAQCPLIDTDQELGERTHSLIRSLHSNSRLARNSPLGAPRARGRALTTMSTSGSSCWCNRKDSRIARRMRLRSTPEPAVLMETARPRRGSFSSLGLSVTEKNPFASRRPRARTASKSVLRRRRRCAGRV